MSTSNKDYDDDDIEPAADVFDAERTVCDALTPICLRDMKITPAKEEVMFSWALVSQHEYAKTIRRVFTKFGGKLAHWPRKPFDFGTNQDHVTLVRLWSVLF